MTTTIVLAGDSYDVGWGQKMFVRCSGSGQPVVVLDSAVGDTSDSWILVEPIISKYTKVSVSASMIRRKDNAAQL